MWAIENDVELGRPPVRTGLPATCEQIEGWFRQGIPFVGIPYGSVPPFWEDKVLAAFGEALAPHKWAFKEDTVDSIEDVEILLLRHPTKDKPQHFANCLAKILVESGGTTNAVFFLGREVQRVLRTVSSYPIIEPYVEQLNEIAEDPTPFLTTWLGISPGPIRERRLPELVLFAVLTKFEGIPLDQDLLSALVDNMHTVDGFERAVMYLPWERLWRFSGRQFLGTYFDSIGVPSGFAQLALKDRQVYLACASRSLTESGALRRFAEKRDLDSLDREFFDQVLQLHEFKNTHSKGRWVISRLLRSGLAYLLASGAEPTIDWTWRPSEVYENPFLNDHFKQAGQIIGLSDDLKEDQAWLGLARAASRKVGLLSAVADESLPAEIVEDLRNLIAVHLDRIDLYQTAESLSLLRKALTSAVSVAAIEAIHSRPMPTALRGPLQRLMTRTAEKFGGESAPAELGEALSDYQETIAAGRAVREVRRMFHNSIDKYVTEARVRERIHEADQGDDPLLGFLRVYADEFVFSDALLDAPAVAPLAPLGIKYRELNEGLVASLPGEFVRPSQLGDLSNLLPRLAADRGRRRVVMLVVDSFSWLDWLKVRKRSIQVARQLEIKIEERYAIAPVPTLTPGNTTALFTGYHPSEVGICDWSVKPAGQTPIRLDSNQFRLSDVAELVGTQVQPRTSLTLVHSLADTPLTQIQKALANISTVELPQSRDDPELTRIVGSIRDQALTSGLTAIYVRDLDHYGDHFLRTHQWKTYLDFLEEMTLRLLIASMRRVVDDPDVTLILTSDHGKSYRFERELLYRDVPESDAFRRCREVLESYESRIASNRIVAWAPGRDVDGVAEALEQACRGASDVTVWVPPYIGRLLPYESKTALVNPNILIFRKYGERHGRAVVHGGHTLSEMIVPVIEFKAVVD